MSLTTSQNLMQWGTDNCQLLQKGKIYCVFVGFLFLDELSSHAEDRDEIMYSCRDQIALVKDHVIKKQITCRHWNQTYPTIEWDCSHKQVLKRRCWDRGSRESVQFAIAAQNKPAWQAHTKYRAWDKWSACKVTGCMP